MERGAKDEGRVEVEVETVTKVRKKGEEVKISYFWVLKQPVFGCQAHLCRQAQKLSGPLWA